jgi:hypothetical protein
VTYEFYHIQAQDPKLSDANVTTSGIRTAAILLFLVLGNYKVQGYDGSCE